MNATKQSKEIQTSGWVEVELEGIKMKRCNCMKVYLGAFIKRYIPTTKNSILGNQVANRGLMLP